MTSKPYGLICPITRVCEVLEPRWTIAILVGLWAGATKFNEIRREIGSISPALLSKRLKELEDLGLIERVSDPATGTIDYIRTEAGIALEPALNALAEWAQCHIDAETMLCSASASNLMWSMRKLILAEHLSRRRVVMQFRFADPDLDYDTYWAVMNPGADPEICTSIPGFDVDLYIETNTVSLLGIVQARTSIAKEQELGALYLSGDPVLARTMHLWMKPGSYAHLEGIRPIADDYARPSRHGSPVANAAR